MKYFHDSHDSVFGGIMKPDEKRCPYCAEAIMAEAIKCRYCGAKLKRCQVFKQNVLLFVLLAVVVVLLISVVIITAWTGYSISKNISQEQKNRSDALGELQYPDKPSDIPTFEEWKKMSDVERAKLIKSRYDYYLEGLTNYVQDEVHAYARSAIAVESQIKEYVALSAITLSIGITVVSLVLIVLIALLLKWAPKKNLEVAQTEGSPHGPPEVI